MHVRSFAFHFVISLCRKGLSCMRHAIVRRTQFHRRHIIVCQTLVLIKYGKRPFSRSAEHAMPFATSEESAWPFIYFSLTFRQQINFTKFGSTFSYFRSANAMANLFDLVHCRPQIGTTTLLFSIPSIRPYGRRHPSKPKNYSKFINDCK